MLGCVSVRIYRPTPAQAPIRRPAVCRGPSRRGAAGAARRRHGSPRAGLARTVGAERECGEPARRGGRVFSRAGGRHAAAAARGGRPHAQQLAHLDAVPRGRAAHLDAGLCDVARSGECSNIHARATQPKVLCWFHFLTPASSHLLCGPAMKNWLFLGGARLGARASRHLRCRRRRRTATRTTSTPRTASSRGCPRI